MTPRPCPFIFYVCCVTNVVLSSLISDEISFSSVVTFRSTSKKAFSIPMYPVETSPVILSPSTLCGHAFHKFMGSYEKFIGFCLNPVIYRMYAHAR